MLLSYIDSQVHPFPSLGLSFLHCLGVGGGQILSWALLGPLGCCDSKAPAFLPADSTNVAFTISMLLGNLSSCCNPWIYMGFNSHLWPRPLHLLACCRGPGRRVRRQLSDGSLSSRRTTLPTRSSAVPPLTLSPTLSGRPGPKEPRKVSEQVDAEALAETGIF